MTAAGLRTIAGRRGSASRGAVMLPAARRPPRRSLERKTEAVLRLLGAVHRSIRRLDKDVHIPGIGGKQGRVRGCPHPYGFGSGRNKLRIEELATGGIAIAENDRLCALSSGGAWRFDSTQQALDYLGKLKDSGDHQFEAVRCDARLAA